MKVWSICLPIFIGSFHLQKYQQSPSFCWEHVPCANLPCSRSPNGRFDFVQVNMPILCSFHGTSDKWWRNIVVAMCERCFFWKYVSIDDIICNYRIFEVCVLMLTPKIVVEFPIWWLFLVGWVETTNWRFHFTNPKWEMFGGVVRGVTGSNHLPPKTRWMEPKNRWGLIEDSGNPVPTCKLDRQWLDDWNFGVQSK